MCPSTCRSAPNVDLAVISATLGGMTAPAGTPIVLVGYDDSRAGVAALRTGADLTRRVGGELRVVHAVPTATPLAAAPTMLPSDGFVVPPPEDLEVQRERVRVDLEEHVREVLAGSDVSWHFDCVPGDAVTVLEEQAEQAGAYVVVVGTRHAGLGTALDRLLTGSTSRGLQKRCRRPVLVVPEPHEH
jgi:nucleotide-binding universal stress UspA family protein